MMLTMVCVASSAQHKRSDLLLKFQERQVDIAPFFEDFPYSQFSLSEDGEKLFFFKTSEQNKWQWLDITKEEDFSKATDAVDLDFSDRNCWQRIYNEKGG